MSYFVTFFVESPNKQHWSCDLTLVFISSPRNIILVFTALTSGTLAYELTCLYRTQTDWWAINNVYFCDMKNDLNGETNTVITEVKGDQLAGYSNADVIGFRAYKKKLHYFPQGLDKYFDADKIQFIAIWSTGLKKIQQTDLSPFKNVRILSLWDNDFEVIEHNLLKFNPRIEYIGLGKNKIKFVDGNVFGHLNNLHTLHIDGNVCVSDAAVSDKEKLLDLLKEIEEKCDVETGSDFDIDVRSL